MQPAVLEPERCKVMGRNCSTLLVVGTTCKSYPVSPAYLTSSATGSCCFLQQPALQYFLAPLSFPLGPGFFKNSDTLMLSHLSSHWHSASPGLFMSFTICHWPAKLNNAFHLLVLSAHLALSLLHGVPSPCTSVQVSPIVF